MLRKVLMWCGASLLTGGCVITLVWASCAGLPPAALGAFLLLALLVERRFYKRIEDRVPGPDWQLTGEQFVDPTSGAPVTVYFQPTTGKRVYVRAGSDP